MTNLKTPPKLEYSGAPFGRPRSALFSKTWRLQFRLKLSPKVTGPVLYGQDSVSVSAMSRGLSVYCGYEGGTPGYANGGYTTMGAVFHVFPGKKYVSVGRDAIDIEPGLASPGDAPGFVRGARPPHTSKPVVYCSAGDLSTVIGRLSAAAIPRSAYFIWSAHWIGAHICGPGTCGYPQADATQYGSNNSFDSDVFAAYVFAPAAPPSNPVFPLKAGDKDVTATGPVRQLQERLNTWEPVIGKYKPVTVDGDFGGATEAAVADAQVHFEQRGVAAGTCDKALFADLSKTPPPPAKPPAPKPKPAAPLSVGIKRVSTYSFQVSRAIIGFKGEYATKIEQLDASGKTAWRVDHNSIESVFTVAVPGPGTYKVTTGAAGYANTVQTVTVTP